MSNRCPKVVVAICWWRKRRRRETAPVPSQVDIARSAHPWILRALCLPTQHYWWWMVGLAVSTSTSSSSSKCYRWDSTLSHSHRSASTTPWSWTCWDRAIKAHNNHSYLACIHSNSSSSITWCRAEWSVPLRNWLQAARKDPRSLSTAFRSLRTAFNKSRWCSKTRWNSRSSPVAVKLPTWDHLPWQGATHQGPRLVRDTLITILWWMTPIRMSLISSTWMMCL